MDLATLIGLIGGTVLIISAIMIGGPLAIFINIPGLLIVLGGTIAANLIKFSLADVIGSIKVGMKAFIFRIDPPEAVIEKMMEYAKLAKKEGLMALESVDVGDEFAGKALQYLVDGYDEDIIKAMLQKDVRITVHRHTMGQSVFKGMGDSAPAFGMIGTLIGLVQMLSSMSDPRSIGPAMAVALLTTLYGSVIANFVCLPLAEKLGLRSQQEQSNRNIIVEACIGISKGYSPIVLSESLKIYLAPKERKKMGEEEQAVAA